MNIVVEKQIIEELGIPVRFALLEGVTIEATSPDVERLLDETVVDLRRQWAGRDITSDLRIAGFYELHRRVGITDAALTPAPAWLVDFVLRHKRFPRVNVAVDLYNLVSATSRLALGAHDCRFLDGTLRFGLTTGSERFWPLGSKAAVQVSSGEYAYMDDSDILCRLEVRQADKTKVSLETRAILLIVQGNPTITDAVIEGEINRAMELISRFCGGSNSLLDAMVL